MSDSGQRGSGRHCDTDWRRCCPLPVSSSCVSRRTVRRQSSLRDRLPRTSSSRARPTSPALQRPVLRGLKAPADGKETVRGFSIPIFARVRPPSGREVASAREESGGPTSTASKRVRIVAAVKRVYEKVAIGGWRRNARPLCGYVLDGSLSRPVSPLGPRAANRRDTSSSLSRAS